MPGTEIRNFHLPGFADLVTLIIIVLVIFGAGKLPAIATSIGRSIQSLRKVSPDTVAEEEES